MKINFRETIKQQSDEELEIISRDYVFYSEEERLLALNELESRTGLTEKLLAEKEDIEDSKKQEEEAAVEIPSHEVELADLLPQKGYLFTPVLIYVNVFVFILMVLSGVNAFTPDLESLAQWGGNIRHLTINGQVWRLLTCTFLHSGIIHLALNMGALLYAGSLLEKTIGKNKFIFAYLASGIVASTSSLMIHENVVSVGASGAVFGVYGVLLALFIYKGYDFPNISVSKMLAVVSVFVIHNISVGFRESGIDNAAHIGGLIAGIIVGFFYSIVAKGKIRPNLTYKILTSAFLIFSISVMVTVPDKIREYNRAISMFLVNEQRALWMYNDDTSLWLFFECGAHIIPNSQLMDYRNRLEVECVDIWRNNIMLLEETRNKGFNEEITKFIGMLIDYSILRRRTCELMRELLRTNSSEVREDLKNMYIQIENKLAQLENKVEKIRN